MRLLLPLVAAAALSTPATAQAEVVAVGVTEGALAVAADGTPHVAYLVDRELRVATRPGWLSERIAVVPDAEARVAGTMPNAVLVESTRGMWLRLVVRERGRWRSVRVVDVPKSVVLGPAGLALDRRGRPVVAYSSRGPTEQTSLSLAQWFAGRLHATPITRGGFPRSSVAPSVAPVLMPDGRIRVLQTYTTRGANAVLWRREGNRWWGRFLHASGLGVHAGRVFVVADSGGGVYVAWSVTNAGPGGANPQTLMSLHVGRSRSHVMAQFAVAAGIVLGPSGPEVAATEASPFGTPLGYILGGATTSVDGRILGYVAHGASRQLLLARPSGLEWYSIAGTPHVRLVVEGNVRGRIEGATGGVVELYLEDTGERPLVETAPVGPDGRFSFAPRVIACRCKLVWVDPATGVPYAGISHGF